MKIGDKVCVTYADGDQAIGRIAGETAKQWKIVFDGTGDEKRINKSMQVELVDDPETPEKEVIVTVVEEPKVEEPKVEKPATSKKKDKPEECFHGTPFRTNKKVRRNNILIFAGILFAIAALGAVILFGIGIL